MKPRSGRRDHPFKGQNEQVSLGFKPDPHPRREANLTGVAPFLPDKVGGAGETPVKRNAEVGSELPADFVAQTKTYSILFKPLLVVNFSTL